MAKFFGSIVKTGKVGGSIFAVRNGVTIERQYQPVVGNPSTEAQVSARARLKLMSQLSEVFASVIAFTRDGLVSSRNRFVSKNYGLATYEGGVADFPLTSIDLTGGILSLPAVTGSVSASTVNAQLATPASEYNRVVYGLFVRLDDGSLRKVGESVAVPGADSRFPITVTTGSNLPTLIVAYGVRYNTESARARYADLDVIATTYVANIVTSRSVSERDISISETRAVIVSPAQG